VFIGPTAFKCLAQPMTNPLEQALDPDTVLVSTTTSSTSDDGLFRHVLESVAQMEFPYRDLWYHH